MRRIVTGILAAATLIALTTTGAGAATRVKSRHDNVSLATAQPIALDPDLVIHQSGTHATLATAQPVSPTYYSEDVRGSLSKHHPAAFFSIPIDTSDGIHAEVHAKDPVKEFTELLLYDDSSNLVAIAAGNGSDGSSSVIDFTTSAPGTWTVEVTSYPRDGSHTFFPYVLTLNTRRMVYRTDVFGHVSAKSMPFFYGISADSDDHLHLAVEGKDTANDHPELLLYDNNGNLVAIAEGNAADGTGSVIDFNVPLAGGGTWSVSVQNVLGPPAAPSFSYDLEIEGARGPGPVVPK